MFLDGDALVAFKRVERKEREVISEVVSRSHHLSNNIKRRSDGIFGKQDIFLRG